MRCRNRIMRIDVCDYQENTLCNLYDNQTDVSGQAMEPHIRYQRNGWKEVAFAIPSVCETETGTEPNYRLEYLVAEYRLRVVTDDGEDWYKITSESVRHEAFSKKYNVTAPHRSYILKYRAMDLEFSDANGNNVGTAKELATTVLEGTGFKLGKVATFYEDDGITIKRRSLNGGPKSNAFAFIEQICQLFDAKPVYHGDCTVDILPMNPFSELEPGEIPEAVYPGAAEDERFMQDINVIELHYDRNVKNLERNINTDNIATRLYGYGAYGNAIDKYCSIQTATHDEFTFTIPDEGGPEYLITDGDVKRYFTAETAEAGDILIWSMLDPNSRSYVWNETKREAYEVYSAPKTGEYTALEGEAESKTNYFPYLSDYSYYRQVKLLTDDMLQSVAAFQRDMPKHYETVIATQEEANTLSEQLSRIGVPKSGYLKLDVESCEQRDDGSVVTLRWSDEHPDGVIYRSDYMQTERNYFRWDVAQALKSNGDPVSSNASVLYIMKDTDPVQWTTAYLKDIDGRQHTDVDGKVIHDGYDYKLSEGEKPKVLTLWSSVNIEETDSVYLFCTDSLSGQLGSKLSQDEAAVETLESQLQIATHKHPVLFVNADEALPEITFDSYGWCYQYNSYDYDTPGILYFSWPARGDTKWMDIYMQDNEPAVVGGAYYYNTRSRVLYHGESGEWVKLETVEEKEVAQALGVAFATCRKRDQLYKGIYDNYYYIATNDNLNPGNYAIPTAFGYYWLFTTDQTVFRGSSLRLDTEYRYVYQDDNIEHIVTPHSYPISLLIQPPTNNLDDALFSDGSIYVNDASRNGTDMATDRFERSNYISVWPNETYNYTLPVGSLIVLYDANRNYLGYYQANEQSGAFETKVTTEYAAVLDPDSYVQFKKAAYIKVAIPKSDTETNRSISIADCENVCFYDDMKYTILGPITHDDGNPKGINFLLREFRDKTDELYLEKIPAVQAAQKTLTDANEAQIELLGDILKEGWWQDDSYVKGDEQRMYTDALDNIKKLAQPEIEYTFDFLDLYGSEGLTEEELSEIEWPDIQISDAAHLIDPELGVDQWAYFDDLDKYFKQVWKTQIKINTQLTLMAQREFHDVLSRIAEVTSATKAKQSMYSRAETINADGTISAENVTGQIDTSEVQITGNGFTTDENGDIILESGDGMAAYKFGGAGIAIANSKNADGDWEWRIVGDGFGLNADVITSGTINGRLIKADSIRANSLMADVGNELDIGSNKALTLFATMDGAKPTGALKTTDGVIEIRAGSQDEPTEWAELTDYAVGDSVTHDGKTWVCLFDHMSGHVFDKTKWKSYNGYTPAMVNIGSGGSINLIANGDDDSKEAPSINLVSGGAINMMGAELNMVGGDVKVLAGGDLFIGSGGTFTVESGNFSIDESGNVNIGGGLNPNLSAKVGGWVIGSDHIGNTLDIDQSSVGLASPGDGDDIVFWAGSTDRQHAPFRVYADGTVEASSIEIDADITHTESTNATIKNPRISGGTIDGSEIKNATTDDVKIHNSVIELGKTNDSYKFSVDKNGYANVTNGTIRIAGSETQYTEIADTGKLTAKNADIQGNVDVNGSLVGTFQGTGSGRFDGNLKGTIESGTTIGGAWSVAGDGKMYGENGLYLDPKSSAEYSLYTGDSDPSAATAYLKKDGDAKCKDLTITGETINPSSKSVKRNIKTLKHNDAFDKLRPVSFKYKDSDDVHFGLIYEETENLYPEICHEDSSGIKGISYIDMIAVLIKEVQDLRTRVAELERRNANGED